MRNQFSVSSVSATALPEQTIELEFDYTCIADEDDRADAMAAARTIKRASARIESDLMIISRTLLDVKERRLFPQQSFGDWVHEEFGLGRRRAQYRMNLARVYGERNDGQDMLRAMGDSVAMLVASPSVPEPARREIEDLALDGEAVTSREAARIIRKFKIDNRRNAQPPVQRPHPEPQVDPNGGEPTLTPEVLEEMGEPDPRDRGWELRQVTGTDMYYCYHAKAGRSTKCFVDSDDALWAASNINVHVDAGMIVRMELARPVASRLLAKLQDQDPLVGTHEAALMQTALAEALA